MAKRKYTARGPKCPSCGAVMHVPERGGEPVCSFTDSHKRIQRARLKAAQQAAEKKQEKS